ncbi:hypothetical protein [Nocardioides aequoreus]|uniref:hypothetical protein n=1 Tax=Nocardioides aequoreus TaxID=397278 RepID=UPI0004C36D5D|nr:hypothetical protein [Nocardioides aequoreus]
MEHERVYKLLCIQAWADEVGPTLEHLIAWLNRRDGDTEYVNNLIDLELDREGREVKLWTVLDGHWSQTLPVARLKIILATTIAGFESGRILAPGEVQKPAAVDEAALLELESDRWFWDNVWSSPRI